MKAGAQTGLRFVLAAALIAATAIYLQGHGKYETPAPPHKDVTDFPAVVGDWQGGEPLPFDADTLRILGPGHFLERRYERPGTPLVDLLLEYFPSQRTGDTMHSPKHCLPGAGWEPTQSSVAQLTDPDGRSVGVNFYVIARGEQKQIVLYWYQAHGRVVASEYWAKFYLVWDAIRLNRTDGSMIRVITAVEPGETVENARGRAVGFAEEVMPMLGSYIPS
ncbi:MAG TPA: EpsI family protein [Terriglobia bacterium]|nr:EpsI family protein [Terriglobia bacterium]